MYRIVFIFIIIISYTGLSAQTEEGFSKKTSGFNEGLGAVDYSFDVGSQVGSTFKDSYWFNNYFSPSITSNLTKKFSIKAGIGVSYSQFNNLPILNSDFQQTTFNGTMSSFYAYASGIYQITPKVNFNATVMVEDALLNSPMMANTLNKQFKDFSMGMNYNVTPHFSINAQMQFSNRPYNGFMNGNSNFGLNSPFGYSPFY